MKRVHFLAALVLLSALAGLGAPSAGANGSSVQEVIALTPTPPGMDLCQPVQGEMAVCLELPESVNPGGEWPTASACVYKDAVRLVAWWYTGSGTAGCVETTHWAWLGTPSVCASAGSSQDPTACIGRDIPWDDDFDGDYEQTVHCLVWVAGSAFCFYD